jgi:RNA polymerase sigma-70 factor (ECF subfamily)
MTFEDKDLIQRFLEGDEFAFNHLVGKWHRPVLNFLYRYTGNMDDAQELTQETFKTVYEKLSTLKDRERFSSWIYTIALNHSRMRLRKRRSRPVEAIEDYTYDNNEQMDHYTSLTADGSFTPEEKFSQDEMADVVRRALDRLDQKQREVIMLKEYTGLKFSEIAEILGTPLSTIKSRMYIGMENLKKEIIRLIKP